MARIRLAVFDVAGTTAKDDGLVVQAFQDAISAAGYSGSEIEEMTKYVNATMGQRKMDVFLHLCVGNETKAQAMHEDFVDAYNSLITRGYLHEFDGVPELFARLRMEGIGIAITTGFPRQILDRIIEGLHWEEKIDISVAASEVPYGRPAPDMVLRAIEIFNEKFSEDINPLDVAVIGDTPSDMGTGKSARVAYVVGVTSGDFDRDALFAAGATQVLDFATLLLEVVN